MDPSKARASFRRDPRGIPQITLEFGKAHFGVPIQRVVAIPTRKKGGGNHLLNQSSDSALSNSMDKSI